MMSKIKSKKLNILIFVILNLFFTISLLAAPNQTNLNTGKAGSGLQPIYIPLFTSPINLNTFSILSWISFIGILVTVGTVIFWIYKIVWAGFNALKSNGDDKVIAESIKKVQNVLVSAAISLFFPAILSLIGLFLGIGTIFTWPKMFQTCEIKNYNGTGKDYNFYFQVFLAEGKNADPTAAADAACPQ